MEIPTISPLALPHPDGLSAGRVLRGEDMPAGHGEIQIVSRADRLGQGRACRLRLSRHGKFIGQE